MLERRLENGTDYNEDGLPMVHGRERFRANAFYSKLADKEIEWCTLKKKSLKTPKENELKVVNTIIKK